MTPLLSVVVCRPAIARIARASRASLDSLSIAVLSVGVLSNRVLSLAMLAIGGLAGCGGSPPPPATHAHFEAIQRQEARQDELEGSVLEGPCPRAAEDAEASCAAAERVCEISAGVDDRDAALRCARARERCEAHRAAARRCHE